MGNLYPRKVENARLQGESLPGSTPIAMDQCFVAHYAITPVLADADRLLDGQATSDTEETVVTTFLAQPDVARTIEVLPLGVTADVPAGDVVIAGADINGNDITESLTFAANATTKQTTTKAFARVDSVTFPQQDGAGATYDVGVGAALGMPHKLKIAALALVKLFDGAADAGSFSLNSSDVSKNLYTPAGTLNGVKILDIYYLAT